jgi:hypothetical protein
MYQDRVLAYIDILGFSDTIKCTNEDKTKNISELLQCLQAPGIQINNKVVNHFSDSIVISYPMETEAGVIYILVDILFKCVAILRRGFPLRGAIVCGKIYHTDSQIFGPALVDAYNMEKKLAIYPRIILDDNIREIAERYPSKDFSQEYQTKIRNAKIVKDFDGLYFLDYFDLVKSDIIDKESLPEHFELLKDVLRNLESKKEADISVKSKYLWLKEKTDKVLEKYRRYYYDEKKKGKYPILYEYFNKR